MKKFYKLFLCLCFCGFILGQVAPFGELPFFDKKESRIIDARPQQIGNQSIIQYDNRDQFIFKIKSDVPDIKTRVYVIDENDAYSGPYYFKSQEIVTNPFTCMECTILIEGSNQSNSLEFELLEITKPVKIHDAVIIPMRENHVCVLVLHGLRATVLRSPHLATRRLLVKPKCKPLHSSRRW